VHTAKRAWNAWAHQVLERGKNGEISAFTTAWVQRNPQSFFSVFSVDRQRGLEVDLCISVVHGINFLSEGHKYCNGLQLVIAIMYYLCLLLNIKHITFWEFNLKRQG
jgi:hypothetical protein